MTLFQTLPSQTSIYANTKSSYKYQQFQFKRKIQLSTKNRFLPQMYRTLPRENKHHTVSLYTCALRIRCRTDTRKIYAGRERARAWRKAYTLFINKTRRKAGDIRLRCAPRKDVAAKLDELVSHRRYITMSVETES